MTKISHHPTEETLAAYASATLCDGNNLVVAAHISHCPVCRSAIRNMTSLAGGLMEEGGSSPISAAARSACFARLDSHPRDEMPATAGSHLPIGLAERPVNPPKDHAPSPLESCKGPLSLYPHGSWQWLSPGIQIQNIEVPSETGTRVFLLKAAPGKRLPDHKHIGTEWTCVLQGAFHHDGGRYGPGDFDEADETFDHNPQVEGGVECICLVAMNGSIEMKGWVGRMIQPFIRF